MVANVISVNGDHTISDFVLRVVKLQSLVRNNDEATELLPVGCVDLTRDADNGPEVGTWAGLITERSELLTSRTVGSDGREVLVLECEPNQRRGRRLPVQIPAGGDQPLELR